jgi:hypothetical protein
MSKKITTKQLPLFDEPTSSLEISNLELSQY